MYLGEDRVRRQRPERLTPEIVRQERRAYREADRAEAREARALRQVQRQTATPDLPPIATTPSGGSPVVTGTIPGNGDAAPSGDAAGGSSTTSVNVTPGDGGGMGILPLIALGAALLFLG